MIQLVKDGKFREDLYYRLNVFPIWVPPLRERLEDVPELARHFLARFAAEEGRRVTVISAEALELLTSYSWPGNVRQLENAMFRAVVLGDGPSSRSTSSRRSRPTSKASTPRSRTRRPRSTGGPSTPARSCSAPSDTFRAPSRSGNRRARHPGGHRQGRNPHRWRPWRPT